jgi:hypothetical protein
VKHDWQLEFLASIKGFRVSEDGRFVQRGARLRSAVESNAGDGELSRHVLFSCSGPAGPPLTDAKLE